MEGISNCLLNTYLYTHKLVQLSPHITEASVCSGQIFIQIQRISERGVLSLKWTSIPYSILYISGRGGRRSARARGECVCCIVSSERDRLIGLRNQQQLFLFSQDLNTIKLVNMPAWAELMVVYNHSTD